MEKGDDDSCSQSNDDGVDCPICFQDLEGEIGQPNKCDHLFCLECIQQWSSKVSNCPVDRIQFTNILVKHASDMATVLRKIRVRKSTELKLPEENFVVDLDAEEDELACNVCGSTDREDELLLCDGCDGGFHMSCLAAPLLTVPDGEWFCPDCEPQFASDEEDTAFVCDEELEPSTSSGPARRSQRVKATGARRARTRAGERIRARVEVNRRQAPSLSLFGPAVDVPLFADDDRAELSASSADETAAKLHPSSSEARLSVSILDDILTEQEHLKLPSRKVRIRPDGKLIPNMSNRRVHGNTAAASRQASAAMAAGVAGIRALEVRQFDVDASDLPTSTTPHSPGSRFSESRFSHGIVPYGGDGDEPDEEPQFVRPSRFSPGPPGQFPSRRRTALLDSDEPAQPVPLSDWKNNGSVSEASQPMQSIFPPVSQPPFSSAAPFMLTQTPRDAGLLPPPPFFAAVREENVSVTEPVYCSRSAEQAQPAEEGFGGFGGHFSEAAAAPPRRGALLQEDFDEGEQGFGGHFDDVGAAEPSHPPFRRRSSEEDNRGLGVLSSEAEEQSFVGDIEYSEAQSSGGYEGQQSFMERAEFGAVHSTMPGFNETEGYQMRAEANNQMHMEASNQMLPPPNFGENQQMSADAPEQMLPPPNFGVAPVPGPDAAQDLHAQDFFNAYSQDTDMRIPPPVQDTSEEYDPFECEGSSPVPVPEPAVSPSVEEDMDMQVDQEDQEQERPSQPGGLNLDIPLPPAAVPLDEIPSPAGYSDDSVDGEPITRELSMPEQGSGPSEHDMPLAPQDSPKAEIKGPPAFKFSWKKRDEQLQPSTNPIKLKRPLLISKNVLRDEEEDAGREARAFIPPQLQPPPSAPAEISKPAAAVLLAPSAALEMVQIAAPDSTDELEAPSADEQLVIDDAISASGTTEAQDDLAEIEMPKSTFAESHQSEDEKSVENVPPPKSSQQSLKKPEKSASPRPRSPGRRSRDDSSQQGGRSSSRSKRHKDNRPRADRSTDRKEKSKRSSKSNERDRSEKVMERAMKEARHRSRERHQRDRRQSRSPVSKLSPRRSKDRRRGGRGRSPRRESPKAVTLSSMYAPPFEEEEKKRSFKEEGREKKVKSWVRQRSLTPPAQMQVTVSNNKGGRGRESGRSWEDALVAATAVAFPGGHENAEAKAHTHKMEKAFELMQEAGASDDEDDNDSTARKRAKKKRKKEKKRRKELGLDSPKHKKHKKHREQSKNREPDSPRQHQPPVIEVNFDADVGDFRPVFHKKKRKNIQEVDNAYPDVEVDARQPPEPPYAKGDKLESGELVDSESETKPEKKRTAGRKALEDAAKILARAKQLQGEGSATKRSRVKDDRSDDEHKERSDREEDLPKSRRDYRKRRKLAAKAESPQHREPEDVSDDQRGHRQDRPKHRSRDEGREEPKRRSKEGSAVKSSVFDKSDRRRKERHGSISPKHDSKTGVMTSMLRIPPSTPEPVAPKESPKKTASRGRDQPAKKAEREATSEEEEGEPFIVREEVLPEATHKRPSSRGKQPVQLASALLSPTEGVLGDYLHTFGIDEPMPAHTPLKTPEMNIEEAELWLDALPIHSAEKPSPAKSKKSDIVDVQAKASTQPAAAPPVTSSKDIVDVDIRPTIASDPKFEAKKQQRLQKMLQHDVPEVSSTTTEHRLKIEEKVQFQLEVETFIKCILKPYFARKDISKDQYKTILKRTVPDICKKSRSHQLNQPKVQRFVEKHLEKCTAIQPRSEAETLERDRKVKQWEEELGLTAIESASILD